MSNMTEMVDVGLKMWRKQLPIDIIIYSLWCVWMLSTNADTFKLLAGAFMLFVVFPVALIPVRYKMNKAGWI